ncbi:MAG: competence/damage-inducible protein A, partial [Clostridia bacterium]|nr:competence/damage-inducible protein A [Clostridia bacterium]
MRADLICVGNELLTGLIENSNSGFLSRRLWSAGITIRESCVIADDRYAIGTTLTAAMEESDLIILTGGLGPTDDDLTKEAVADILGLSLVLNQHWLDKLEHFFFEHAVIMPVNNRKQAFVIEGSLLLENQRGTAPGLLVEKDSKLIVLLPGPPHELQMMFDEAVLPILVRRNQGNLTKVK